MTRLDWIFVCFGVSLLCFQVPRVADLVEAIRLTRRDRRLGRPARAVRPERRNMASRIDHLEQRVANLERAREEDRKS